MILGKKRLAVRWFSICLIILATVALAYLAISNGQAIQYMTWTYDTAGIYPDLFESIRDAADFKNAGWSLRFSVLRRYGWTRRRTHVEGRRGLHGSRRMHRDDAEHASCLCRYVVSSPLSGIPQEYSLRRTDCMAFLSSEENTAATEHPKKKHSWIYRWFRRVIAATLVFVLLSVMYNMFQPKD